MVFYYELFLETISVPIGKNIIAIYHAKLKPLKSIYVIKALVVWIMAIIVIFLITLMSSASFARGEIIMLVAITYTIYAFLLFNYPFIDVAKLKLLF